MSVGWLKTKTYWGKVDGKCGQTCGDKEIVTMRGEHTIVPQAKHTDCIRDSQSI